MKRNLLGTLTTLAALALSLQTSVAADPDADQLLRQMSEKLAAAKQFSFKAVREIDPALLDGEHLPTKADVTVDVKRPDKFAARAKSEKGVRRFIADGKTLTLVDEKAKHYAVVPMKESLDGLVDRLDEKYGFAPPLAEFAASDLYANLKRQAESIEYVGQEMSKKGLAGLTGVECHRIALRGKVADAELWISVKESLPRKLVATFHVEGDPKVSIQLSDWKLSPELPPDTFAFTPPEGAEKIEMLTLEQANAATKTK